MKYSVFKRIVAVTLILSIIRGCGTGVESGSSVTRTDSGTLRTGMLDAGVTEYSAPSSYPAISVDLVGYSLGKEKKAVIHTEELPDSFSVVDVASSEVVYEGKVKPTDTQGYGIADFSGLDLEGTYVLKAPFIGTSKSFDIGEGIYDEVAKAAFLKLHKLRCSSADNGFCHNYKIPLAADKSTELDVIGGWHTGEDGARDVVNGCLAAYDLMVAYEYHPSSFGDDWGIKESGNRIPDILDEVIFELNWLMKMQNPDTGGVYTSITREDNGLVIDGEASMATVNYCVVMTHFANVIRKFDKDYSSSCLKAAQKAWKCLEANKELVSAEQMYRAAVELYKATGNSAYKAPIDAYLKDNADKEMDRRAVIDAAVTHMSTSRPTDMASCEKLMSRFMSRTHAKSAAARTAPYMVESEELTAAELLRNTEELVIVDYIISSEEYTRMEENYLHFLCGRNPKSEIMLDYGYDPDSYAMLLVLLGKLLDE